MMVYLQYIWCKDGRTTELERHRKGGDEKKISLEIQFH